MQIQSWHSLLYHANTHAINFQGCLYSVYLCLNHQNGVVQKFSDNCEACNPTPRNSWVWQVIVNRYWWQLSTLSHPNIPGMWETFGCLITCLVATIFKAKFDGILRAFENNSCSNGSVFVWEKKVATCWRYSEKRRAEIWILKWVQTYHWRYVLVFDSCFWICFQFPPALNRSLVTL